MCETLTLASLVETYLVSCDASLAIVKDANGKESRIASAGVAVIDSCGAVILSRPILVGGWTRDTTALEFHALCLALQTATELGVKRAVLVNDNEQAVVKMNAYLTAPATTVPKVIRSHIQNMDSLTVRLTTPGEERLPHDLAHKAIADYRAKKSPKKAAAVKEQAPKSSVVKVTVTDELLRLLDKRLCSQNPNRRSEYIRVLLRRDLLGESALQQILAPIAAGPSAMDAVDNDLDELLNKVGKAISTKKTSITPKHLRHELTQINLHLKKAHSQIKFAQTRIANLLAALDDPDAG